MTTTDEKTHETTIETDAAQEFAGRMAGVLDSAALAQLLSVGHQTGLLDTLATLPPSTSDEVAEGAGLRERYVREWLNGVTVRGVVEYDPARATYWLPHEHAASLTRAAGPHNLATVMQVLPMLGEVEQQVIDCFTHGGGVGYAAYERFHGWMAEQSAAAHDAGLVHGVVPLVPGLSERLRVGADVADIGCGSGHALNLLARAFPAGRYVGYDFEPDALQAARRESDEWGLTNTSFELVDVAELGVEAAYDVVTAFDAIHDQAHPARVLENIHRALKPGGIFLMVDISASSHVEENPEIPWATFIYTTSLLHCMTVSLSQGGDGLGTAWGRQTAVRMLGEAGFADVEVYDVETDPFNTYYVARR